MQTQHKPAYRKDFVAKQGAFEFFYHWAGFSYDPKTEAPEEGRYRSAKALADAEAWAWWNDCTFDWTLGDETNREWTDEGPEYATWACLMRDSSGEVVESVRGVDLGPDGSPFTDHHARCVQAELAREVMGLATHD